MKIRAWSLCLVLGMVLLTAAASAEQVQETQKANAKDIPVLSEIGSSLRAKLNSILSIGDDNNSDFHTDDLDLMTTEEKQKKQQELMQAQQKAYYSGYMSAFNAMRFQQQMAQEAHRRRRLHQRHLRHMRAMKEKRSKKIEERDNKHKSEEQTKQQAAKARNDMDELFGAPHADNNAGASNGPVNNNNNNDDNNNNNNDNNGDNNNDNNSNNNDDNNNNDADNDAPVHHHRRHRHHRRRHTLNAYPYFSPTTYFQQYYGHPALSSAIPFYGQPAAADHHHHRHHHDDEDRDSDNDEDQDQDNNNNSNNNNDNNNDNSNNNNNDNKQNDKPVSADQMRFRESFQSGQHFAYGDPYNSRISSSSNQMGAYGPPMDTPDATMSAPSFPPAPHEQNLQQSVAANLNMNAAMFHPPMASNARNAAMMRFSQAAPAAPAAGGQAAGNQANPGGVPMPFYPPTAPPPPAPNQIPMSPASVNAVYPENFQIESTADMPMAAGGMTQTPGANPAGQVMAPNQPNAEVNSYPFSF